MKGNISPEIFREYDIRGDAERDLTDGVVEAIGRAYGAWLGERAVDRVSVGGDVRLSTPRIRSAVVRGLTASGIDVVDIGTVTTPMLYWSMHHLDLRGAVMITGSHNPPNMNGLKLGYDNATLWGDSIQEVRRLTESDLPTVGPGTVTARDITDDYLAMLASRFEPFSRTFKVVCDSGNGTAGPIAERFFKSLGCACIPLYAEPDGRFPNHHPDPQKRENLQDLIEKVKASGADVGFAFDGDADRLGVVDEHGTVIFGDRLMALYWAEILKARPGTEAIVEPKCSMALPEEIERLGGRVLFWKSGHSVIKAKMREIGAPFAGELSGHMFFADEYYGFDDSFYAAGRVLRILSSTGRSLSDLMASIPLYPATEEARIDCPDSEKFEVIRRIRDKALKDYKGLTLDGIRILYPGGWGLIRASNTQPVITTRCEGRDEKTLAFIMEDVKKRLRAEGLPAFTWTF